MTTETNLFGLHVEGRHEGRVGNIYNNACKTRYIVVTHAIEMVEASLGRQINTTHVIYQQKPTNQPTQAVVSHIETYHNKTNARQAVDSAVENFDSKTSTNAGVN
jgi:hypothetical protein